MSYAPKTDIATIIPEVAKADIKFVLPLLRFRFYRNFQDADILR